MNQQPQNLPVRPRLPEWLKVKAPGSPGYMRLKSLMQGQQLHTVCEEAHCPNIGECWDRGTATFMILGNICTRSCGFCSVVTGRPLAADYSEPKKVAESIRLMKVKHAVITSVDRDDLQDGGAEIWAMTINEIRKINPTTTLETLIPDFKANTNQIQKIIEVKPEIVSHNLETVRRLTKKVRIQAKYDRSLKTLQILKAGGMKTKSGIMLGLGETENEIIETMHDLREVGVSVLTMGQYLQPTTKHLEVVEFVNPQQFQKLKEIGLEIGFRFVESGPLVRSSYHAEKHLF